MARRGIAVLTLLATASVFAFGAAAEHGLPVAIHPSSSGVGWYPWMYQTPAGPIRYLFDFHANAV